MGYRKRYTYAPHPVTVPQLSGGLNVYDTPSRLAENQLTECDNLWLHDGALRTRPGLKTTDTGLGHFNCRQTVNEREQLLCRLQSRGDGQTFYAAHLSTEEGLQYLGATGRTYYAVAPKNGHDATALGFRAEKNADTGWYFLLSGGDVIKENPNKKEETAGMAWVDAQPYVPTVFINGKGEELVADVGATAYEDYNMLTRKFSCTYTTDGTSQNWKLPQTKLGTSSATDDVNNASVLEVELTVFGNGKLSTYTTEVKYTETGIISVGRIALTTDEAGVDADQYTAVELQISVNRTKGIVRTQLFGAPNGATGTVPINQGLPFITDNNLKITAWRNKKYEDQRLEICRMTRHVWFGGDRSGIEGGSHLFVCGNPDKPNLLRWGGVEHPLYFPERNYCYIGDANQAITGFGKQGDLLMLFKEREIYALQYVAGTEEDTEFALAGGVSITTYSAKFTVTPISPAIGCNCPDTIRMVNNRLVWLNSDGQVFTLTSVNQYSERNVRMISRNIRPLITEQGEKRLQTAQAAEYRGYYLLLTGKKVFLLDTQTSAFNSFNYYSDEESARKALPWFVWTLPNQYAYTGVVSDGNTVRLTGTEENDVRDERAFMLDGDNDDGTPIDCRFATKWWSFSRPDAKISVEKLIVSLGCDRDGLVWLTYLTDQGEMRDPYALRDDRSEQERESRYLRRVRTTPHVRMVQGFGLRMECAGTLEVGELYLKTRQQGVVR